MFVSAQSWVWWCRPVLLALRRLRQGERELKDSLDCIRRPFSKQTNKNSMLKLLATPQFPNPMEMLLS
jgi:hypothetical protein